MRISPPEPGSRAARRAGLWSFSSPGRDGGALFAVPATPLSTSSQESLLAGLRARIEALERHATSPALRALGSDAARAPLSSSPWTLGAPEIDAHLMGGLDASSLHEVKPQACAADPAAGASAGQWAAALGFALRLAVRRSDALDARSGVRAPVLWCWTSAVARELGQPCGQGLAALGLDPRACLFVETKRASEALWAMEEGLKSASLALVVGVMKTVELTPARRLALAAAGSLTPCLIVTDPRSPAAGSTATRWRIGARKSAAHSFDRDAPGARRFTASLERCRHAALAPQALSLSLEWSDETHRFRVASALAHRADAPRHARSGA
jgi:protein ImuA